MTPGQGTSPTAEELAARLALAEEAIRARDDLLAIAAHELRSPLNALALRLATLERMAESGADPALREQLRRAGRQVRRYVQRATTLLDISRLNTGAVLERSRVRMRELVDEVVDAISDEAAFHRIRLDVDVSGDRSGDWDAHMVEQMLSNLLSNAIKYGGGTPVSVRAGVERDGMAWFSVADGGPGIPAREQRRLFERFERVVPRETHRSGFGLGLWIVARMAQAHGGSIEFEAAPQGGSIFTIRLPLEAPAPHHDGGRHGERP